jgi:hypothetical protein
MILGKAQIYCATDVYRYLIEALINQGVACGREPVKVLLWTGLQIADEHAAHIDGIGREIAGQAQILPIQLVLHHEGQSMVDEGIVALVSVLSRIRINR